MDIYDKKAYKGLLKSYNQWFRHQLYDCVQHAEEPNDAIEKYELVFKKLKENQITKPISNRIFRFGRAKNIDFLPSIVSICTKVHMRHIVLFLKAKDIWALLCTCKTLNSLFDSNQIWDFLLNRDYGCIMKNNKELKADSKLYYRYKFQTLRFQLQYHTKTFVEQGSREAADLVKTMSDIAYIGVNNNIRNLLVSVRINNSMIDNLKLSISKEDNEVYLWFSGFDYKGTSLMEPLTYILRTFSFPEKSSLVKNAFFLKDQYLVIELEENLTSQETQDNKQPNQQRREEKTNEQPFNEKKQSFVLHSLMKEIEYLIFGNKYSPPVKISFQKRVSDLQEEPFSSEKNCFSEKEFSVFFDTEKEEYDSSKFIIKLTGNDEIACFRKGSRASPIILFNLPERKKLWENYMKLEYPLYDIVSVNKNTKNYGDDTLLVIDYHSNLYQIKYNHESTQSTIKISPNDTEEESKHISEIVKDSFLSRFPDSRRKYHHGIYEYTQDTKKMKIEYLILQKGFYFYFIELPDLKVHRFDLPQDKINFKKKIYDWVIVEDKIFILTDEELGIWRFTFPEFAVSELVYPIQTQWKKKSYHGQWIRVDPCYTIIASSFDYYTQGIGHIELLIGSTQELISGKYDEVLNSFKTVDLEGILIKPDKLEVPLIITPENIQIKFQHERLLMKAAKYSFFYDLNPYKPSSKDGGMRNYVLVSYNSQFTVTKVSEDKKTETNQRKPIYSGKRKKKHITDYKIIPENRNHNKRREGRTSYKECSKKDYYKSYRDFQMLLRQKGRKYIRNIWQSERLAKIKQNEILEEIEEKSGSDLYFLDEEN